LHYRNETDPTGFAEQIVPLHIVDGVGSLRGSIKHPMAPPIKESKLASQIGPGESGYTRYDRSITAHTCRWLRDEAPKHKDKPWAMFCSFVCPHYPLIVPQEFYELYPHDILEGPKAGNKDDQLHPWIEKLQKAQCHDDFFSEETRKIAIASYYGLCSYLDSNIKKVLDTLDECGLRDDTLIVYTSDHGENLGTRRLWGKSSMYEEAVYIPLILSGAGIPSGKVVSTPVTLAEGANTILATVGLGAASLDCNRSWCDVANATDDIERVAFSEYHASGADTASYMIRKGKYKYIHYVDYEPELFDLDTDPEEIHNLATDPSFASILADLKGELTARVDPDRVNAEAQAAQAALIEKHGGRDAVLRKGSFQGTPAPGEKTEYV
jgi:choline-sulfatase